MDSTKVIALIPAYSHIDWRLQEALAAAGISYKPFYECSDLPKARSQLLSWALAQADREIFLLIDSDVVPTVEQIQKLVDSPMLTPTSAVMGGYVSRDNVINVEPLEPGSVRLGQPGFARARSGGLGFCAIHRASLEAMKLPTITLGGWRPFCVPFVVVKADAVEYLADDYSLWQRLTDSGTDVWFDQELLVAHVQRVPRVPAVTPPAPAPAPAPVRRAKPTPAPATRKAAPSKRPRAKPHR